MFMTLCSAPEALTLTEIETTEYTNVTVANAPKALNTPTWSPSAVLPLCACRSSELYTLIYNNTKRIPALTRGEGYSCYSHDSAAG